ncbi:hypothetical protein BHU72_15015 [Desulfuribacillus stibiiarsenatis]|uniref:DUF2922 domain-containing protein n=1 Tax=Desulfuribacillus stibiiarsenatis TaxID=1390249 RepID=A0A1E5L627_9FIRM|nr:DUF2922 domain-containing protein [Desulfuribacillus stibiiarsenatis]OEH85566.1 hypothetical protein BHU72_15015 [Desulfuribacillus stibiiarsenatis]
MSKKLELVFRNREGKMTRIAVDNPKEPVDTVAVQAAMDTIIAADAFNHGAGLVEKVSARLIDRTVEDIIFE